MSNSALVTHVRLSPNHSGLRRSPITRITPHYACPGGSVEALGELFANPARQASSNYGIGNGGEVGLYVDEANRAWTSGSFDNDNRAVTIECCNQPDGSLTDACWARLVELCADICRRNGIADCSYTGDTTGVLTMHRWFQNTDCPGPWLSRQFARLSREVNALLRGGSAPAGGKVSVADVAARIHADMCEDPANGYSQAPVRWGGDSPLGSKTLVMHGRSYTYKLGSYDCSSSVITAWRLALKGTPYEGRLDGATYTGDMRPVFLASGLFHADLKAARRGDVYLAEERHAAMCQDGGSDGVYGYDCLTEFVRNELHGATGGKVGDQDGGESLLRTYYDDGWDVVLHYNGKADFDADGGGDDTGGGTYGSQGGEEMVGLINQGGHLYYYDGGSKPRHIDGDQLSALNRQYKRTHGGASIPECKDMPKREFDALCRLHA